VKLGFALAVLMVLGIVLYYVQLRGPMLGWSEDLEEALARGQAEGRHVVLFVRSFPVSEDDKWMVLNTLAKEENRQALKKGNFILVERVLNRSADWARKYGLTGTPTMLVIAPDGKRFHRQEGRIGETEFRDEFLKAPLREPRPGP
jgi:hypothetical protein